MNRETTFVSGTTVVTATWLNNLQDVESASAWGITLIAASSTVIRVAPAQDGTAAGAAGLRINGLTRFVSANVDLNLTGAGAATLDIYASAGAGPGFTLVQQVHLTAAPANSRKIAEVDWNGTAITAIRNMVDAVSGHGDSHRSGGPDALSPLSIATAMLANGSATSAKTALSIGGTSFAPAQVLSTTAFVDITGATFTIVPTVASYLLVAAAVEIELNGFVSTQNAGITQMLLDGGSAIPLSQVFNKSQSATITPYLVGAGVAFTRYTLSAGSHTIKLQGKQNNNASGLCTVLSGSLWGLLVAQ